MPFHSPQQEAFMFAQHPQIAAKWQALYGNAPGFTAGGFQPYTLAGGRQPGQALTAMLRGGPSFLPHPMDVRRAAQKSLADHLRR